MFLLGGCCSGRPLRPRWGSQGRRRSWTHPAHGGGPDSRGTTFLPREEWRRSRQGKKVGTTLLSPGDRSAPARCPSARSAIAEAAPGRPGQSGQGGAQTGPRDRLRPCPAAMYRQGSLASQMPPMTAPRPAISIMPCRDRRAAELRASQQKASKDASLLDRTPSRPEHRTGPNSQGRHSWVQRLRSAPHPAGANRLADPAPRPRYPGGTCSRRSAFPRQGPAPHGWKLPRAGSGPTGQGTGTGTGTGPMTPGGARSLDLAGAWPSG